MNQAPKKPTVESSGRIAGSGGGTEDQSYFSIGGFAKAGF